MISSAASTPSNGRIAAVIPAYNAEATLERAITSAQAQTHPVDEIWIVDDGSSDATLSIAHEFALEDARVTVLHRDVPSGAPGAPRNLAILSTSAEWIAFLDADDEWLAEKTALQIPYLAPEADVVFGNILVEEGGTWRPVNLTRVQPEDPVATLAYSNHVPVVTVIARREAILRDGGFDESRELAGVEDWHLWLKIALSRGRFVEVPHTLAKYYHTSGSLTTGHLETHLDASRTVLERLATEHPDNPDLPAGLRASAQRHAMYRLKVLRDKRTPYRAVPGLIKNALRDDPSSRIFHLALASLAHKVGGSILRGR